MSDPLQTNPTRKTFDFHSFPPDTLFYERREGLDRREREPDGPPAAEPVSKAVAPFKAPSERRAKKERRRRIDPTTFEKQYTDDEIEFMGAMQRFKTRTGKSFPSHGEVLAVAYSLGYRKLVDAEPEPADPSGDEGADALDPVNV